MYLAKAVLLGLLAFASTCHAQGAWPSRNIKIVVPYGPGGASDIIARHWAEGLRNRLGQAVIVENRAGASGVIGTEAVARAAPDGYTLLVTPNAPLTVLPHMRKVPYDPQKDLRPVARLGDLVGGFAVHPSLGIRNWRELKQYVEKNPGKLHFGSPGPGTGGHLRLEMLKYRTGWDIAHIPYKGTAEALKDLLGNTIQMMNEVTVLPHHATGKLTVLALNYPVRSSAYPDIPTLAEVGLPHSDVPIWYAMYAPAGTPDAIVAQLNAALGSIGESPEMQARLTAMSVVVPRQKPDEVSEYMRGDSKTNLELIRAARITAD